MSDISKRIFELGIVPVVKLDSADDALPLAKALLAGGLPCAEITFRTDAAEESIRRIASALPEMLIGAGTVLTIDQVDRAMAAGAHFIVSPGFNPTTAKYCVEKGIPIFPGCPNAASIEQALELGLTDLKFFPAEQSGGLDMIKALCGPFTKVRFMPTGGINEKNLGDYLAYNKIIACGGSWMVKPELIQEKRFDEIERITRESVRNMLGFKLVHVGINCANEAEANATAKLFESMFGFAVKEGNSSTFAGDYVECMKAPYLGRLGHLAIGTKSLPRAIAYMERQGFATDPQTAKTNPKGEMVAVYFKDEIAGFAVHLVQSK